MSEKTAARRKNPCYIKYMSKAKVKKAVSAGKAARGTAKKSLKLARAAKKSAKANARRKAAAPSPRSGRARVADTVMRTASPPVQPAIAPPAQILVRAHKYRVGETVYFTSPSFGRAAATGSYTVVKLLPSEGDDYQYRIKNSDEAFERVAKESQLDRA
jgi:hypothetical protein